MKANRMPRTRPALRKQSGFALTSELVLLSTVLVLGLTTGLVVMRDAITGEMNDVAEAVGALNQSYTFDGLLNEETTAQVEGSVYVDGADTNAGDGASWSYVAPTVSEGNGFTGAPVTGTTGPAEAGSLADPD